MPRNSVTKLKDVASAAGVSSATASRVLTGQSNVSPATRERVLRAIEQLNYRPDQIARSLRRRQTNLIGLVVSTIENAFFTEVARAAERAANSHGYHLIVCNTDENEEREKAYLTVLNNQLVAGVIVAPAPGPGTHLSRLIDRKLPLVLINRHPEEVACSTVTCDDEAAAYACVGRLVREGRRRIAAVSGLSGISTTSERLRGYRRACVDGGLTVDPSLEVTGHAQLAGAYHATFELMQRSDRPDALFVFNNVMIVGVVTALLDLGLRWPDTVDVAGFGAFDSARLYRPPLTLIAQPTHEMGERAVQLLLDQIEGGTRPERELVVLHNRVIPREEWIVRALHDSIKQPLL